MKWFLITIFVVVATIFVIRSYSASISIPYKKSIDVVKKEIDTEKLLELINNERDKNNLSLFIKSERLCDFAKIRLVDNFSNFSHDGFVDGYKRNDYFGFNFLGENLSKDFYDEHKLVDEWLKSPKHAENIKKNSHSHTCIQCKDFFCVQIFGGY